MIDSINNIPRTNVAYLGWEETLKNKDKLDEFNSRFDLKIDTQQSNNQQLYDIKKTSEQKDKTFEVDDMTKLANVLHHNVLQNIPTQEILKIKENIKN